MERSARDRRDRFRTLRRCPLAQPTGRRIDGYCQESCEEVRREEARREEVGRQEASREEISSEESPCKESRPEEGREEVRSEAQTQRRVHEGDDALLDARRGRRRHA